MNEILLALRQWPSPGSLTLDVRLVLSPSQDALPLGLQPCPVLSNPFDSSVLVYLGCHNEILYIEWLKQ